MRRPWIDITRERKSSFIMREFYKLFYVNLILLYIVKVIGVISMSVIKLARILRKTKAATDKVANRALTISRNSGEKQMPSLQRCRLKQE